MHGYTSAQPKVTMRAVSQTTATAMSIKQQTLPSIKECVSPKQLPIDSPLFGCNLDDDPWCFSSVASRDSVRSDASWRRFLQKFDGSEFKHGEGKTIDTEAVAPSAPPLDKQASTSGAGGGGEITPDIDYHHDDDDVEDVISNVQRVSSDPSVLTVDDVVPEMEGKKVAATGTSQLSGRKYAGQKKEKTKEYKGDPFSRKTVPVAAVEDDQDLPIRYPSPPFNFKTLIARKDIPLDEVAARSSLDLSPELRRKLEMKFVEWNDKDICSSASSIGQRSRWRTLHQSRSAKVGHKKQTSGRAFTGSAKLAKTESMRKAAGVHDGRRKRETKRESWVRV